MNKIVGIGACVMDTLISLPHYPSEDTKLKAEGSRPSGGGPVATALVAASKLGSESAYIGVLSSDNGGKFLIGDFEKYGVRTNLIRTLDGYRSFTSVIWLSRDTASRTCVFDRGNLPPLVLDKAQKDAICHAEILMVDGNELSAAIEGAKLAKAYGTKILYDCGGLYEGIDELLPFADIMIPSEEFALKYTGKSDVVLAAEELYTRFHPEILVITRGKEGGLIYGSEGALKYPAFVVDAKDTNGSGDVFHGAFASAYVSGLDTMSCCLFASATSAIKCTAIGARESVPTYREVIDFLKERGYEL